MKYELNGQAIDITKQQVIDGKTYAKGSLLVAAVRQRAGIVSVPQVATADRTWYFVASDGSSEPKDIEMLRKQELPKIKQIRQNALDKALAKSSGVGKVYGENMKAIEAIKEGKGDATTMNSGKSATEHVEALAANMGKSADDFKDYIKKEVEASAQVADEIENEYLRVAYTVLPEVSFDDIQTLVSDFSAFCEARTNPPEAAE